MSESNEDIPVENGFQLHSIKDLILGHASGPSPTCEERPTTNAEEWGLLKTTAVTWNGWNPTAHKVPPKEFWGNKHIEVHKGDVLVTKAGPRNRCGVVVYVDNTPPKLMVSGKMIGLRPDPKKANHIVLAAALSQHEPQRFLDRRTTGMADAQLNFTNDLLLKTKISLPSLPTQRKIARILQTVDRAIEQTEALIEKYQQIKAGLMHDLFTRGLWTQEELDRGDHKGTSVEATAKVGQLRPPREQAPQLYQETSIGWVSKVWEVTALKHVSLKITDGDHHTPIRSIEGIYLLSARNVLNGGIALEDVDYVPNSEYKRMILRCHPEPGDVLISCSGTVGRVALVPDGLKCCLVRSAALVKPNIEYMSGKFLEKVLQAEVSQLQIKASQKQAAQPNLFQGQIEQIKIPITSSLEQECILSALCPIDRKLSHMTSEVSKLQKQKSGLMHDLLTGKKPVTPDPEN
jgi:type I restriction enzyme, S subunit